MHRIDARAGVGRGGARGASGRVRRPGARAWIRGVVAGLGVCAIAAAANPVVAQVTPETPRLLGSEVPRGFGAYAVEFGALGGDGRGLAFTWTGGLPATVDGGLRLRGGFGEGAGGEDAGFGGVDVWRRLTSANDDLPVDLLWTTGAGVSVGEWTLVSVPVGISAGVSLAEGSIWINPYVHAGVVFDYRTGDEAPDDEFEVGVATDLGVHVAFDRSRRVVLSAAAGLGDRQALAIGVVLKP